MDKPYTPLADLLRPGSLAEYYGQEHILAENQPLRKELEAGQLHSMILWGPPGSGKTTLANIISQNCQAEFIALSAVLSGVKDIRSALDEARKNQQSGKKTVLFVDEVHRFNKAQQDAFLPHIESGLIIFIGATTENPSFELNNALLSRSSVYVLKKLSASALKKVFKRALSVLQQTQQKQLQFETEAEKALLSYADGDARRLLNAIELLANSSSSSELKVDIALLEQSLANSYRALGNKGDVFYEQISALHKSVRGSNPDASLYWFCRMIDGGCDPHYISRRLIRMASEDIGNADPRALQLCINAAESYRQLGSPEGELALAQAVIYLASCPKSNAVYMAYKAAMKQVKQQSAYEVPIHLRNAPTQLMQEMGMGKKYRYAHDEPNAYAAGENYFPQELTGTQYYFPVERGMEIKIKQRLDFLKTLDQEKGKN